MSAITSLPNPVPAPAPATPGTLKVTQARVLRSEWLKFRSLRSTLYTSLTAVVLTIGISALMSALTASQYPTYLRPRRPASIRSGPAWPVSASRWWPSGCWVCC